jgi:hypothetical protein
LVYLCLFSLSFASFRVALIFCCGPVSSLLDLYQTNMLLPLFRCESMQFEVKRCGATSCHARKVPSTTRVPRGPFLPAIEGFPSPTILSPVEKISCVVPELSHPRSSSFSSSPSAGEGPRENVLTGSGCVGLAARMERHSTQRNGGGRRRPREPVMVASGGGGQLEHRARKVSRPGEGFLRRRQAVDAGTGTAPHGGAAVEEMEESARGPPPPARGHHAPPASLAPP